MLPKAALGLFALAVDALLLAGMGLTILRIAIRSLEPPLQAGVGHSVWCVGEEIQRSPQSKRGGSASCMLFVSSLPESLLQAGYSASCMLFVSSLPESLLQAGHSASCTRLVSSSPKPPLQAGRSASCVLLASSSSESPLQAGRSAFCAQLTSSLPEPHSKRGIPYPARC